MFATECKLKAHSLTFDFKKESKGVGELQDWTKMNSQVRSQGVINLQKQTNNFTMKGIFFIAYI